MGSSTKEKVNPKPGAMQVYTSTMTSCTYTHIPTKTLTFSSPEASWYQLHSTVQHLTFNLPWAP